MKEKNKEIGIVYIKSQSKSDLKQPKKSEAVQQEIQTLDNKRAHCEQHWHITQLHKQSCARSKTAKGKECKARYQQSV